jgi:hypothetical protein
MSTSLKVKLTGKTDAGDEQTQLVFGADYHDERNKEWAKYTPAVNFSFVVRNDTAAAQYTEGAAYTLTLEESE